MQFYVAFPLALALLQPRQPGLQSRVVHLAGWVVAMTTLYRGVTAAHFQLPVPVFGPHGDPERLKQVGDVQRLNIGATYGKIARKLVASWGGGNQGMWHR